MGLKSGNRECICFLLQEPSGVACVPFCVGRSDAGLARSVQISAQGARRCAPETVGRFFQIGWAMGCRCAERRTALTKALVATAQGDSTTATKQISFVARTTIEDANALRVRAADAFSARVQQARMKLGALR